MQWLHSYGAFQKSELAGRTMVEPVILNMKQPFSKSFCRKTIFFVHAIQELTDLAGIFFFTGIKSVTTGMASWPVSSDEWKAPLVFIVPTSEIFARLNNCWTEIVHLAVTFSKIRRDIFFEVCRCIFRLDQHFHVIHVRQYRVVKFFNMTSLIFTLQASRIIVSCMFICCRELQLVISYCQRAASRRRGAARRQHNNKPCAK